MHPADGYWDLIHAKRGSYAAANFIVILTLLTSVWRLRFTSFVVMNVHWEEVNIFEEFASILIPLLIFCVCNWALTTLFDGKGHLGDIYMGSAYALTPYPLIQIPIIILSNIVTKDEAAFYDVFNTGELCDKCNYYGAFPYYYLVCSSYLYGNDDDSSVRIWKNTVVYNFYHFRNAHLYFYHAVVLQYDFTGN